MKWRKKEENLGEIKERREKWRSFTMTNPIGLLIPSGTSRDIKRGEAWK